MHIVCFSYGVVMWEMLTRQLPHENIAEGTLIHEAHSGQLRFSVPESVPKACGELLLG